MQTFQQKTFLLLFSAFQILIRERGFGFVLRCVGMYVTY
jgi:hypothetical protein